MRGLAPSDCLSFYFTGGIVWAPFSYRSQLGGSDQASKDKFTGPSNWRI